MTTTPDPKTVNELALEVANIALHDAVHVDQWISAVVNSRFGNECSQVRAPLHIAVARRMSVVKPSWPDEQPQDGGDPCAVCYCRGCTQCVNPSPPHEVCFCRKAFRAMAGKVVGEQPQDERDAEIAKLRADLAEMTGCRNAAMAYAERRHVPIELDDEIDIDGEELAGRIEGELLGPGWDWEDDRTPGLLAKQAVAVIRPHLARLTDQAQKARAALAEARDERDDDERSRHEAELEAAYRKGWTDCGIHARRETDSLLGEMARDFTETGRTKREIMRRQVAALDARDAKGV